MTNMTLIDRVLRASKIEDLMENPQEDLKTTFSKYQKAIHPDRFSNESDKIKAHEAFTKLGSLNSLPKTSSLTKIASRKHEYTLGEHFPQSVYEVYDVEYDAGHEQARMFVTKDPRDSNEAVDSSRTLKTLRKELDVKYQSFIPKVIDSFKYVSPSGSRGIVVTDTHDGFVPMYRILERHPNGISGRNVAWIFRRILFILGGVHDSGYSHGNISLESFLIHAPGHGLIVTDWGKSKDNLENRHVDISNAATVAETLLETGAPRQLTAFFKGCRLSSVPMAHELLAEFDELLKRIYGPPKFTELIL